MALRSTSERARAALVAAVLVAVAAALQTNGADTVAALRYDRAAVGAGEWWRLWTCHLVHLGYVHLLLNAAALALLVLWCPAPLAGARALPLLLVLGGGVGLGLHLLAPQVLRYVGLSGVIYGLFALGLAARARHQRDRWALLALLMLAARVVFDLLQGPSTSQAQMIGGTIIVQAHVAGLVTAAVWALTSIAWVKARHGRRIHIPPE